MAPAPDRTAGPEGVAGHGDGVTAGLPPAALVMGVTLHVLPPPWFVPAEAPACGAVLDVPAAATNDGMARRFVCDQTAGHLTRPEATTMFGEWRERHRQVTDNEAGEAFTWAAP